MNQKFEKNDIKFLSEGWREIGFMVNIYQN